jgi:hypothetical protein
MFQTDPGRLGIIMDHPQRRDRYLQGFKSPYFNESHVKLRQEARKFFAGDTWTAGWLGIVFVF